VQLVRLVKERHRTERAHEKLKGQLGLDHFEGRTYPGWHHHVTVALVCFAFIVAERARRFSPRRRTKRPKEDGYAIAGTAPCPPILDDPATGLILHHRDLVAMPKTQ
jgi:SRSO17 transposase